MATELATAYLSLIPTLKGAGKRIQSELDGVNIDPSGKKMGKQLGDGLTEGAKSGGGGIMSAIGGIAKVAGPALAAIGFSQLVGEAAAATDATQKFKSTLDFAGLGAPEIEALSKSTRKYADETVYALSDIQNITAQLAANSVPNYDKLAEAAGNLNAVAGGNAETFSSVGMVLTQTAGAGKLTTENWNQLADAIPGASGKLQEAMLKNGAYTGNFREAMEKGEITAAEFNEAIMQLGFEDAAIEAAKSTATFEGAFGNLQAAAVGGISDILTKLQPAITGAINGITPIVEGAFTALSAGVGIFIDKLAEVWTALQPFIEQAQAQLASALSEIGTAFQALWTAIQPVVQMVISTVVPLVGQVITLLASLAATIMSTVAPVITNIAALITTLMPTIQMIWTTAMTAIMGVVNAVWPFIQTLITTVMNVINAVITTVLAIINGDWVGAWEGIKAVASSIWEGIKSLISAGINAAKGVIGSVLGAIKGIWDGAWNGLKSFVGDIWEGIKTGVSNGIDAVMSFIGELPGKITGFFSDAGTWLLDAGSSILHGLWDGISGAMGWLGDQLAGIGDFIISHKGPPSYDAVMLVKNGELIMGGLLDGMTRGWGDVEDFIGSRNAEISASYSMHGPRMAAAASAAGGSVYNMYLDGNAVHVNERVADAMERFVDVVISNID